MTETADRLLNVREAATLLGVAEGTIRKMIARGTIPVVKLPGVRAVRFRLHVLEQMMTARNPGQDK